MTKGALAKLLQLPADERADLAGGLWDSLRRDQLPVTAEECGLIDERLAEAERNPESTLPWSEVRAELWPKA